MNKTALGAAVCLALLCTVGVAPASVAKPRPPDVGQEAMGPQHRDSTDARARARVIVPARSYGPLGIDVSGWQPTVDWKGWWAKGKRFAYVKATEGTSFRSKTFSSQYTQSARYGYIRGAYHYANPAGKSGWRQADYFIANGGAWSADGKTLPGMLDLEAGKKLCYGRSQAQILSWIASFRNRYRERTGRHVVIYTNASWWRACTGNTTRFSKSPLFIARWNTTPGTLPGGWKDWTFWQYTDTPLDQDMFNGSYARLKEFAKKR